MVARPSLCTCGHRRKWHKSNVYGNASGPCRLCYCRAFEKIESVKAEAPEPLPKGLSTEAPTGYA